MPIMKTLKLGNVTYQIPISGGGSGMSSDAIAALLNCFSHVAWTDGNGQQYYDALYDALTAETPVANVTSISAVFSPGTHTVYNTDTLASLRPYLTVTANYDNGTSGTTTGYTLSGTLSTGTSTITVSFGGKTTTFNVTVVQSQYAVNITESVMTRKKGITPTAPNYSQDAGGVISYLGFDLMLEPNKNYQIEWECSPNTTAAIGVKIYNQTAITQANNGENISSGNYRDLGQWFDYGSPVPFTTSSAEGCVRFQIRQDPTQTISNDFHVQYFRVKEVSA